MNIFKTYLSLMWVAVAVEAARDTHWETLRRNTRFKGNRIIRFITPYKSWKIQKILIQLINPTPKRGTKSELRADLRTYKWSSVCLKTLFDCTAKDLENLTLIRYVAFAGQMRPTLCTSSLGVLASYPIQLSLLLISVKVYRGHGSLGNNYLGQLMPSAWNDFLF